MRILVGMSGGFDSTLAAKRLIDEGHTVEGAVLVMHDYTDTESARLVCDKLGIRLHVIECKELFAKNVIENFKNEYKNARTPNPCVICNPTVKFFALFSFAMKNGFDRIATGHYARIEKRVVKGKTYPVIVRAKDAAKDQSYMLYRLPPEILDVLIFPLANDVKSELRQIAKGTELEQFDRPDSQEICFIPDGDYAAFVSDGNVDLPRGNFVDKDGRILGEHKGIVHYTVGQRKGLGISLGERMFVKAIDPEKNEVMLDTAPAFSTELRLYGVHLAYPMYGEELRVDVKIRYAAKAEPATVRLLGNGEATVRFDTPVRSVTPGQSAVFYEDGAVLGGGFINR